MKTNDYERLYVCLDGVARGIVEHYPETARTIREILADVDPPNAPTKAPGPAKRYGDTALCTHMLLFVEQYLESPVTLTGGTDGEIIMACLTCGTGLTMAQFDRICEAASGWESAVLPVAKADK